MNTRRGAARTRTMAFLAVLSALVLTGCNDFFAAGWGSNASGQLGNGTTTYSADPVDVNTDTALQGKVITDVNTGGWITGTSGTGYLSVTPPETAVPSTSMVNWYENPTTRANGSIVPTTRTGLRAYTGGDFSTQYLYDTAGFFR